MGDTTGYSKVNTLHRHTKTPSWVITEALYFFHHLVSHSEPQQHSVHLVDYLDDVTLLKLTGVMVRVIFFFGNANVGLILL